MKPKSPMSLEKNEPNIICSFLNTDNNMSPYNKSFLPAQRKIIGS